MKICCICKNPLNEFGKIEIVPGKVYADFECLTDLLPQASCQLDSEEKKEQRKKEVKRIIRKLAEESI